MFIPKRPLWLRAMILSARKRHLRGVLLQAEESLSHALSVYPEEAQYARERLENVDRELNIIYQATKES
jgi:hypothetical protein